ncbi:MAG: amidohydrolase family protein [Acidimicrobiales bacterium]
MDAVAERRRSGRAAVDHRVLYRLEARTEGGFEAMRACLEDDDAADVLPLVSYEDHTPGQGQYRNLDRFLDAMSEGAEPGGPGQTREQRMAEIMAQAAATQDLADRNRSSVAALASSGRVRALAHDVVDAEGMEAAFSWGARVAEFPITVEAARAARQLDLPVVCGGPNALRGQSHSGNVAATELVGQELCTVLASDYLPTSLLAAVWSLTRQGILPFADAVGLVTTGPARAVGLRDRGRIAVGLRADLVLVADDTPWPRVRATASAGCWHGQLDEGWQS